MGLGSPDERPPAGDGWPFWSQVVAGAVVLFGIAWLIGRALT